MRIIVTGGSGMLGHCLMRQARRGGHQVWGSYHTHSVEIPGCSMFAMDVTDEAEVRTQLRAIAPDLVIHTAALTDVDECEKSPAKAESINSGGTRATAKITEELGARFVFLSSDYVFNGAKGDYSEHDSPSPVNQYGRSKLLGEEYARQVCSRVLIVRTTIFGLKLPPKVGMMESLVNALRRGAPLTRFADQYFTPLYTGQLSDLILRLVDMGVTGLFHVGAIDKVSRFEFARHVAETFALACAKIQPVPFQQIPGLAMRPRDTSLLSRVIIERTGIQLPNLRDGLLQLKQDWEMLKEGAVSR